MGVFLMKTKENQTRSLKRFNSNILLLQDNKNVNEYPYVYNKGFSPLLTLIFLLNIDGFMQYFK